MIVSDGYLSFIDAPINVDNHSLLLNDNGVVVWRSAADQPTLGYVNGSIAAGLTSSNDVIINGNLLVNDKKVLTEDSFGELLAKITDVVKENELLRKFGKAMLEKHYGEENANG